MWATNLKSNYTGSCKKNILFIVMFVCLFLYSLTTLNSFIDLPVWQLIDFARSFLLSTQLDITHLDLLLSLNDLHYAQFVQFTWLNCTPFFRSYVEYLQKPYILENLGCFSVSSYEKNLNLKNDIRFSTYKSYILEL